MKKKLNTKIKNAILKNDLNTIKDYIGHEGEVHSDLLNLSALEGKLDIVKYALSLGIDVNCEKGLPLRNACLNNHINIVRLLVEQGADINILEGTPLYIAVREQCLEIVKFLIGKKVIISPDNENDDGLSLIEMSIPHEYNDINNNCEILTLLLPLFSPEYILSKQEKLLNKAIYLGNFKTIQSLIELNPSQEIIDKIFLEVTNRTRSNELMKFILSYNPDINYQKKDESHYSMSNALSHLAADNNEEMVDILLQKGMNQENKERALRWAVYNKQTSMVKKLLSHQININSEDREEKNYTALTIALMEVDEEMIEFLLKNGADIYQNYNQVVKIMINHDVPDMLALLMYYGLEITPNMIKLIEDHEDTPNLKEYIKPLIAAEKLNKELEVKEEIHAKPKL